MSVALRARPLLLPLPLSRAAPALLFLYPPRCRAPVRPRTFTTTTHACSRTHELRSNRREREITELMHKDNNQAPTPKLDMKRQLADGTLNIPDDIGLLPNTLLMPTGANKPALYRFPRARLRLEWTRLRNKTTDLFYVLAAKWAVIKPRPKLHTRRVKGTAQALHRQMYTALADGDEVTLRETCCAGLGSALATRLRARPAGERWTWRLHRYKGRPRIMSHKIAAIPLGEGKYLSARQVVVRIRSLQSLTKTKGRGPQGRRGAAARKGEADEHAAEPVEATPKDMTEYVVVQQLYSPNPAQLQWKVWGTMEEDPNLWKKYL